MLALHLGQHPGLGLVAGSPIAQEGDALLAPPGGGEQRDQR